MRKRQLLNFIPYLWRNDDLFCQTIKNSRYFLQNEILNMPYELKDYWNDLDASIVKFDQNNRNLLEKLPESKEDESAYKLQRDTLLGLKMLWVKLDSAVSPIKKISYGKKMDKLPKDNFGQDQVPFIRGSKSFAFAQQVYLPHLLEFNKVKFNSFFIELSKLMGTDLEAKKANIEKKSEILKKRIENYIIGTKQGIFSAKPIEIVILPESSVQIQSVQLKV